MKMRHSLPLFFFSLVTLLCLSCTGQAQPLRLAVPFSDGAILQCELPLNFWGVASPGQVVEISLDGAPWGTATADASGHWKTQLPAQAPGQTPHSIEVRCGKETIPLENILFGEVWLASGQSNMAFGLKKATGSQSLRVAKGETFRFANMPIRKGFPDAPIVKQLFWKEYENDANNWVSAVAAFFGIHLTEKINRPVGIIVSALGATPAEAWTPLATLEAHPETAGLARTYHTVADGKTVEELKAIHKIKVAAWKKENPGVHVRIPDSPFDNNFPCRLYENMIVPLTPFTVRGVIWYQGENNAIAAKAEQYRVLFPAMIQSWRDAWKQPDMSFFFVQLSTFNSKEGAEWPELREAQAFTRDTLPNTGMAVSIDVGEQRDIHPRNKRPVGERLAKLALRQVYGQDVPARGPVATEWANKDKRTTVRFDCVEKGLQTRDGSATVPGFEVAGEDGVFHSANAQILAPDALELDCSEVTDIQAIRYAFDRWVEPPVTLENSEGLPAEPFRFPRHPDEK